MHDLSVYAGLFLAAFVAPTVVPIQSEAALVPLLWSEAYPAWVLLSVASVGNTLGSVVNWALGRSIEQFRHKRWFPVRAKDLERAQNWYLRYGRWSLLLSWAPFIGDPITFAAGILRERLDVFLVLVAIAKTARYLAVAWLVLR